MNSQEFNAKKEEVADKIKSLIVSYGELMKLTSPQHWRVSGHYTMELQKMERELQHIAEISKDELDIDWVKEALKQV